MSKLSTLQTKRTTIGVLTSGLEDQYQTRILEGAFAAAAELNVNLIVFSGGELDSPVKDRINGNVIYRQAVDPVIDAMILFTGTIFGFVDDERQAEFCRQYPVPQVSIGSNLPHAYNVLLNNEFGVQAALRHLIDVHGCRRIAFIQGPPGNEEAALRYAAYVETLAAGAIPFDPLLVVPGKFQAEDGEQAVRILIDERQVDFDAIVATNDNMAFGALDELRKRKIAVPAQVAVAGFDDIDDAEAVIPALTTVRQPLFEQGKCGVEVALALLHGETLTNPLVLNPELIIRRSCGCFPVSAETISVEGTLVLPDSSEVMLATTRTATVAAMLGVTPSTRNFHWIETLYDAFIGDLFDHDSTGGRFVSVLDSFTQQLLIERARIRDWHEILTVMRNQMIPYLGNDVQRQLRAGNLWQQGRVLISDAVQHAEADKQLWVRTQTQALNSVGKPLIAGTAPSELRAILTAALPVLGVKSCRLALYEGSAREVVLDAFSYDQDGPPAGEPVAGGVVYLQTKDLLSQITRRIDRRHALLVEPLHFGDIQFGFLLLEIEKPNAYFYEALRDKISTALHTALIMRQLEEKHTQLETAMQGLKTTQSMLVHSEKMNALGQMVAGVAHEINNPIAFVNSNVHSLGSTFDELVAAYDALEGYARAASQAEVDANLTRLRREAGLEFLVDDTRDLIEETLKGLKRVKDIVTELRTFSRLDEAEFKLANLRENLESTLLVAGGELRNRVTVALNVDPTLALTCAPAELNQVFLNIIMNAAQAIQGPGTITIDAVESDDDVTIEFADSGPGIPQDVIDHIFDPFFTTKPAGVGTGLGLAISHKIIVDSHHGSIQVTSQEGVGARFTIRLPKEIQKL